MKKLINFEALFFDIDRTLTNTQRQVSPETLVAIKKLSTIKNNEGNNFKIGACSGRGVASLKNKILPLFPDDSLHITAGGSQLVNSKGEIIWEQAINPDSVKKIRDYVDQSNLPVVYMKADAQYAKEPILSHLESHPWNYVAKNQNEMSNDGVNLIYISKLNDDIINYVKNDPDLSYKHMTNYSGDSYIDITAKGVNKSVTLKVWSQQTGIPLEKVIGFGDSQNDIEFLQACGFSVAMGNAIEEVRQLADRTIGDTDDNGLAKYLTKIIEGENL